MKTTDYYEICKTNLNNVETLLINLRIYPYNDLNKTIMSQTYKELRNDFEDDGYIFIDGWIDMNENSDGTVVAKISIETKEVIFVDESAKNYENA